MRSSLPLLLAAAFPGASLIDLGATPTGHSYFDPDRNETIHLNSDSLEEDASISGVYDYDEEIMVGDDGREYVVRPVEDDEPEIGRRRRNRDGERRGLVDRVSDARQESLKRRLGRSEEREEERDERQAKRRGENTTAVAESNGLPDWLPPADPGFTWERWTYDFTGSNTSGATASVTVTKTIGSQFVIERASTTGTTAAALLLSLQYGDDYIFNFSSGSAVENYATNGFLLESWKGKMMKGASSATLIVGSVANNGVVRFLLTGYRLRPITC